MSRAFFLGRPMRTGYTAAAFTVVISHRLSGLQSLGGHLTWL